VAQSGKPFGLNQFNAPKLLVPGSSVASGLTADIVEPIRRGFTVVELLISITIIGALAAIAIPEFAEYKWQGQIAKATGDLRSLDTSLLRYKMTNDGSLPSSLSEVLNGDILDPWERPYQYLKIEGNTKTKGEARKDKFLVPINSDFDLYSMGPDGKSAAPLTAQASHDDIIRANDGGYFGLASDY
jgi:general secretion pathway protein G